MTTRRILHEEDKLREAVKELKDFLNMQRKAFNDLFDVGGEYPDQRVLAHLHTCINSIDNKIEELFGEKLI